MRVQGYQTIYCHYIAAKAVKVVEDIEWLRMTHPQRLRPWPMVKGIQDIGYLITNTG